MGGYRGKTYAAFRRLRAHITHLLLFVTGATSISKQQAMQREVHQSSQPGAERSKGLESRRGCYSLLSDLRSRWQ